MIKLGETKVFHSIYAGLHYCPHEEKNDENKFLYLNEEDVLPIVSMMDTLLEDAHELIEWAAYTAEQSKHKSDCYEWISNMQEFVDEYGLELTHEDFTKKDYEDNKKYFEIDHGGEE